MFIYMYITVVVFISLFVYHALSSFVFSNVFCSMTILVYLNMAGEPNHTLYRRIISYTGKYNIPHKQQVWQQSITCFSEKQRFNLLYISVDNTLCIFFPIGIHLLTIRNQDVSRVVTLNKNTPFHTDNLLMLLVTVIHTL